jgi:2',3'-cyclic-nucleotide 2'-phosphodiesterase (5'-nucleotidase family)
MWGEDLLKVLKYSVSTGGGLGKFLQVSGLRFSYTVKEENNIEIKAEVLDGENWTPVTEESIYRVVLNNFMAEGGDGYNVLKTVIWQELPLTVPDLVMKYLQNNTPSPTIEGRITK